MVVACKSRSFFFFPVFFFFLFLNYFSRPSGTYLGVESNSFVVLADILSCVATSPTNQSRTSSRTSCTRTARTSTWRLSSCIGMITDPIILYLYTCNQTSCITLLSSFVSIFFSFFFLFFLFFFFFFFFFFFLVNEPPYNRSTTDVHL